MMKAEQIEGNETVSTVEHKALTVRDEAKALIVTDETEYAAAGDFIVGCKSLVKEIQAFFKPMKDKAFAAHRAICDQEANTLKPVNEAINIAATTALPWKQEQDRLKREADERARQERIRQEQEAKLKEAETLERWGEKEEAEKVLQQAVVQPRPVKFESAAPKVAGLSTRKVWKARIVDPRKVNHKFCQPDVPFINQHVKSFFAYNRNAKPEEIRKLEEEIGGVEVYQEESFAGARRG